MKAIIIERVLNLINEIGKDIDIGEDQLETELSELGMDSIGFIKMIVAIEEAFECEIPDEKLLFTEMGTVQKIVDVLQSLYDASNESA